MSKRFSSCNIKWKVRKNRTDKCIAKREENRDSARLKWGNSAFVRMRRVLFHFFFFFIFSLLSLVFQSHPPFENKFIFQSETTDVNGTRCIRGGGKHDGDAPLLKIKVKYTWKREKRDLRLWKRARISRKSSDSRDERGMMTKRKERSEKSRRNDNVREDIFFLVVFLFFFLQNIREFKWNPT